MGSITATSFPTDLKQSQRYQDFREIVAPFIEQLYQNQDRELIIDKLFLLIGDRLEQGTGSCKLSRDQLANSPEAKACKWSEDDVLLITYGDTIFAEGEKPLHTLSSFLKDHLLDTISGVHILPFFPYSSDDGFAVIDYTQVKPDLGDWPDIKAIAQNFDLMMDLVINHVSSQHQWLQQFKAGEAPGCHYFIEVDPSVNLSQVVRPRSSPLLAEIDTKNGKKYLWATFSHDQIDLNFANPDVLLEILQVIMLYLDCGARYLRLDAVGYVWKIIGTPCIHLRETHLLIKLMRKIIEMVNPSTVIITETNVPNRENLSYFGNRDEADMIYNFSLPPLLLEALLRGKSDHLRTWMMSMPPSPRGCTYFNFTASHDGIGLRPAEGLIQPKEIADIVKAVRKFGGKISMRTLADGTESIYEINVSLFDALKGTIKGKDNYQIPRFLCSQTIMMALEGLPAFYIHSLLATPNNKKGIKITGHNRTINRARWNYADLQQKLADPQSKQSIVLRELSRLIRIRRQQKAFHPNAVQYTLQLRDCFFGFWRQSLDREQSLFAVHNLSNKTRKFKLKKLNLVETYKWRDLISDRPIEDIQGTWKLGPYECLWITNEGDLDLSMIKY